MASASEPGEGPRVGFSDKSPGDAETTFGKPLRKREGSRDPQGSIARLRPLTPHSESHFIDTFSPPPLPDCLQEHTEKHLIVSWRITQCVTRKLSNPSPSTFFSLKMHKVEERSLLSLDSYRPVALSLHFLLFVSPKLLPNPSFVYLLRTRIFSCRAHHGTVIARRRFDDDATIPSKSTCSQYSNFPNCPNNILSRVNNSIRSHASPSAVMSP